MSVLEEQNTAGISDADEASYPSSVPAMWVRKPTTTATLGQVATNYWELGTMQVIAASPIRD